MARTRGTEPVPEPAPRPAVLEEIQGRIQLLRDSGDAATDTVLAQLGGSGKVEREIVAQLGATSPIAHPEHFVEAHSFAMHALEVLARNGSRAPSQLQAGFLTGPARTAAQPIVALIVKRFQAQVARSIRDLYARRLAWAERGDPSRRLLVQARLDVERTLPTMGNGSGGLPTFLVGGAAVSSLAQLARTTVDAAVGSKAALIAVAVATFLLLAAASWIILRAAAVARRRIRITMDPPLNALWETVGHAGKPPRDSARSIAVGAIALTFVGFFVLPAVAVAAYTLL